MLQTKKRGNGKIVALRSAAPVALIIIVLIAVFVFGGIPTCEEELAKAYPPALRADLSACDSDSLAIKAGSGADAAEFARRLNGTWALHNRTVQGIIPEEAPISARLYFDIEATGTTSSGAAFFVERAASAAPSLDEPGPKPVSAFWKIGIDQPEKRLVSLVMKGDPRSSYNPVGTGAVQETRFSGLKDTFVASPGRSGWDRVVLSKDRLTYVSCERGFVERYVKMSSQKPSIAGMSLEHYWEQLNGNRKVARLDAADEMRGQNTGIDRD